MWLDGNCDDMRNVVCEIPGITPVTNPPPVVFVPPVSEVLAFAPPPKTTIWAAPKTTTWTTT